MKTTGEIPFKWVGSKAKAEYGTWLLPKIPYAELYCEPFFGSGAVFFSRNPSPNAAVNDLDGAVVNFFRVLQCPQKRDALIEILNNTPYSQAEYYAALHGQTDDAVVWAKNFFISREMSVSGKGGFGRIRGDKNPAMFFRQRISRLSFFSERLLKCQITCVDAKTFIRQYDTDNTVFYCDPPYLLDTRVSKKIYKNEMTTADHVAFLETVKKCRGAVCISGYPSECYMDLLSGWDYSEKEVNCLLVKRKAGLPLSDKAKRTECLWRNQRAIDLVGGDLFSFVPDDCDCSGEW